VTLDEALAVAENTGEHSRTVLVDAIHVLADNVEAYRRAVTAGGPPPRVDADWANVDLAPPASASDPSAPPIRTGRGSDRLVAQA
jgi:hypothetical protein